ncbi:hypothetical protein F2Q69_00038101 [Brassica cretica]|uniref:Uncharacterized protein n=1 Tax=Brassica cretica TaxID=69181 RepID=A0A8S9SI78_BRACR|nr:hypothetical protein F2Q69_00038101 [Brassica cretica]
MLALYQRQLYRKSRKSDWRVVLGESHSSALAGAGGSHSLVSVQAQDWVSRDAVTRRYTGGSELGFCLGKLLGSYRDFQRRHLASLWIRGEAY